MIDVIVDMWTRARAAVVDLPGLDTPVLGALSLGWALWLALAAALIAGVCGAAYRVQRTATYLDAIGVDRRRGESARYARWVLALVAPSTAAALASLHRMTDGHPGAAFALIGVAVPLLALASGHIRVVQLERETEHHGARIGAMKRRMDETDRLLRAVRRTAQQAADQAALVGEAVAEAATETFARIEDTLVHPITLAAPADAPADAAADAAAEGAPVNATARKRRQRGRAGRGRANRG